MARNGKKWQKMAKIGGKILGSNIYLCKKLTFRNSVVPLLLNHVQPLPGVVYESLCPYSRQFIRLISHLTFIIKIKSSHYTLLVFREEVHPAYTTLSEFFDVEFVAYGGASVSKLNITKRRELVHLMLFPDPW